MRRPVSPHVTEYTAQRKGDEAEHIRRQVQNLPLQDRYEVVMTFAATAAKSIQHPLRRPPKGYLIVGLEADLTLYRRPNTDTWDAYTFTLYNASANTGEARVWVF